VSFAASPVGGAALYERGAEQNVTFFPFFIKLFIGRFLGVFLAIVLNA
jgi:hypothetical protein